MIALERAVARPLFVRRQSGYELTDDGRTLLAKALAMEAGARPIEDWLAVGGAALGGAHFGRHLDGELLRGQFLAPMDAGRPVPHRLQDDGGAARHRPSRGRDRHPQRAGRRRQPRLAAHGGGRLRAVPGAQPADRRPRRLGGDRAGGCRHALGALANARPRHLDHRLGEHAAHALRPDPRRRRQRACCPALPATATRCSSAPATRSRSFARTSGWSCTMTTATARTCAPSSSGSWRWSRRTRALFAGERPIGEG